MPKRQVFFSFHYDNDMMRVQQIRMMGAIDGDLLVNPNTWEGVKAKGETAIKKWIDDNMQYRTCVIVLIGEQTSNSKWVNYEIQKALAGNRGLFGIYIHNLKCPRNGYGKQGESPFNITTLPDGRKLSSIIDCYNPNSANAYVDIMNNIENWIEKSIKQAGNR